MACFLVPTAVGFIVLLIAVFGRTRFSAIWRTRIAGLNLMLWGGSLMLAVEHYAHQEIVPYFPFLTRGMDEVLPELVTVGVPMTLVIFAAWGIMVAVSTKVLAPEKTTSKA
ncbi:MAG: hypothetical protein N3F63_03890 [Thermoplasmata archaeon]|nr:hypothetical protein [Thermoplasmata archaeon]